jgi:acyl-CoA carboxylase subunit beta
MKRLIPFRSSKLYSLVPLEWDDEPREDCPSCGGTLIDMPYYAKYRVCDHCGIHFQISARRRIASLVDSDTFRETDRSLFSGDPLHFEDDLPYAERLVDLHRRLGQGDALIAGTATLHRHKIVVAAIDFRFLGGSMGVVVGEKIVRAAELAASKRRPLITVVASGGARMQEGLLALAQMAKSASEIDQLKESGLPYISVLAHPTTGGVYASFASLGDVLVAEPRALIGFAGPRVAEQLLGRPLPPGSHSAEFLLEHGLLDSIVDRIRLRSYLATLLDSLMPRKQPKPWLPVAELPPARVKQASWDTVERARDEARPTAASYIEAMMDEFVELHGDRSGTDDPAIIAGFGLIEDHAVAVIATERGAGDTAEGRRFGRPMPGGYRKAQRICQLAERLDIPVVTIVDTPGAFPGIESEAGGLAGQIAATLALLARLKVPTVAAIVGEGGSGGALALAVGDRVLMQSGAIYSVIAPEGAAAILYRDAGRAPELAEKLKITAEDAKQLGVVDQIVPEPPGGAAADAQLAMTYLKDAILTSLDDLCKRRRSRLVKARRNRYRQLGSHYVIDRPPAPEPSSGEPQAIPAD